MKRLVNSMVLAAAAVAALAGCAKETVSEQASSSGKLVDVKFTAEIPAYQTTKSTVDVNGLTFNTRWADGDKMGLSYAYGESTPKTEGENIQATYSKDGSYTVKLPEYTGAWEYYVYYPYQTAITSSKSVEIPFGAERTQNGNSINSDYDLMQAIHAVTNGVEGKDDDGCSIQFEMERLTSLLYFHFTSSLTETVQKATLTVDGDPIAAEKLVLHVDMTNYTTSYVSGSTSNSIVLNLTDVTADDFMLWFNILPYGSTSQGIKNIKLVVETETKTFSITNPNSELDLYKAGQVHSINLNIPDSAWKDKETPAPPVTTPVYEKVTSALTDWSGDYLIVYEGGSVAFDGSLTALGSTNNYKTVTISGNKIEATDEMDGISFVFAAIDGGYSIQSASGYYIGRDGTSNGMDISRDSKYLNTIKGTTVTGKGNATLQAYVIGGQNPQTNFRYYKSSQETITLYKRSVDIIRPVLDVVSPASLMLTAQDGTTDAFAVTTNQESWDAVSDNDAFTVNKTETGFTVSAPLNPTLAERKATITVTAGNAEQKTFTVTQSAASFEITSSEVVLKAIAGSLVQRTITSDYNWAASVSTDAKFTVSPVEYTYADGGKQVIKFTASEDNSSADGTITLGTVVFSNSVNNEKITVIVKQESSYVAPFITLTPESGSVAADATSASFAVKSNVDWTVSTDASWVTLGTTSGSNDGTVALSFTTNDGTKERVAVIAVSSADGKVSNTYTLTQKFPGSTSTPLIVTYDFTKISGFNDWGSSYTKHVVKYDVADVVFSSANKNTGTITDRPVTKGQPICVVMSAGKTIKSVKLICKQWGTKSQTITLNTSTDGGTNYTATTTKSSNFTLSASDIADGVNAVKFTFSSTSNQVGISSLELTYTE